jgi:redox-regulated HSP33 family molecular chaperone
MNILEAKAKISTILSLEGDKLHHQWQALGYIQALRDRAAISNQEYTELKDFIFELPTKPPTVKVVDHNTVPSKCLCRRCQEERKEGVTVSLTGHDITQIGFSGYILCEFCGNKRCPHATDHRHACTNSNKPGQPGSIFQ